MLTLPRPDDFGNYYVYSNAPKKKLLAAIFRSKRLEEQSVHYREAFFAIVDHEVITQKDSLKYFDDPQQALNAINQRTKNK